MTAAVFHLPTSAAPPAAAGPTMSEQEVTDLCGGYVQPVRQLKALHALGFSRAYISTVGRKRVVLERAHAEAVQRGEFGGGRADPEQEAAPAATPNRAGLARFLRQKRNK